MNTLTVRKSEQGFTLVELAIVMIIIGLLLGGLLKGQELITNARVTSSVAQVKALDAATTAFRDKFDGMPGDIANPAARVPNCLAAPCAPAAPNANGLVDLGGGFAAVPATEALAFFLQLSNASLISGIRGGGNAWGQNFPEAEIGGGYNVSYMPGGTLPTHVPAPANVNIRAGHYLAMHNNPTAGPSAAAGQTPLTPNQAFRMDNKLDDGIPTAGTVFAAGQATCVAAGAYNEIVDQALCNLYIRFQQ